MTQTKRIRTVLATIAAVLVVLPTMAVGQSDFSNPDMPPVNDLPNPYETIEGWAEMPAGRSWGSTSAVDLDPDGVSIWVAERCGANVGACVENPDVDPIMKFDADGNMVTSFGAGLVTWPHGIAVDADGNVWVTDARGHVGEDVPDSEEYGHQVLKFSPQGELLMALGAEAGVPPEERATAPEGADFFWQPNDVLVAPNGDIFVGEGHGADTNRIIKFDSDGNYLMAWGETGDAPGQFNQPHGLAMDSQGRLFVADRGNDRIQIFTQDGEFLEEWYQFSRLSGIYIDENDTLYGADSESGSVNPAHGDWLRGIRVGSARTGEVEYLIPDPQPDCRGTCTAEGVVVDVNGVVYGAEVGPVGGIKRYVR